MSQASFSVVLASFSYIQRGMEDGVHTHTHHCALSAARGQGQRNLEFPEAAISELEKKDGFLHFLTKGKGELQQF